MHLLAWGFHPELIMRFVVRLDCVSHFLWYLFKETLAYFFEKWNRRA
jgi:hypothetical protein